MKPRNHLTDSRVLAVILERINTTGQYATIRELCAELDCTPRAVQYRVAKLATQGLLKIIPNVSRGIRPANVIVLAFTKDEMMLLQARSEAEKTSVNEHIRVKLNLSGKY